MSLEQGPITTSNGRNSTYHWGEFDAHGYTKQNYGELNELDRRLGDFAVRTLGEVMDQPDFTPATNAADVGTGGGLRTGALITPLVADRDKGGRLILTDVAEQQVAETERALNELQRGNADFWQAHEDAMTEADKRWTGALRKLAAVGTVLRAGINDLHSNAYGAISSGHCAESATGDPEEYKGYLDTFYKALEPGGIFVMPYVVGSSGYMVGQGDKAVLYPAVAVYPEDYPGGVPKNCINLDELTAQIGFTKLGHRALPHTDEGSMRAKDDPTTYAGLGLAILQRPS